METVFLKDTSFGHVLELNVRLIVRLVDRLIVHLVNHMIVHLIPPDRLSDRPSS